MTEVYIVEGYTPYGGSRVFGVYSTTDAAKARVNELMQEQFREYECYEYNVWEYENTN